MSARRGFSLIEALVALIVASIVLLAVFELQNQLASGQSRYEHAMALAGLERDAMVLTSEVNPMAEPRGVRSMAAGRTLDWTATPLTEARRNTGYPSGAGRYDVRLYRLDVHISDGRGRALARLSFERLGWSPAG